MYKNIICILVALFAITFATENISIETNTDQLSVPQLLNYQGKLTQLNGNPVVDSTYSITFRFFSTPTAGTALWTETQSIQTHAGIFNCLLGSTTPITSIPTDGNCYLEMQVNPNPAMTPRIRIVSSAYAFLAKKADTASYALSANVQYVDSTRVSANSHKIQGKDTIALSNKFVDEGQINSITSAMINDGTILRQDVASTFKAPYSDTSDYARTASISYVDSTRISANSHKLQGLDTAGLDNRYVNEGQYYSISSSMIIDGTIQRSDVMPTFKAPFADTSDYARAVTMPYVDSSRVAINAYNAYKLQGKDTTALDARFVNEGQVNAITNAMIIDNAVTSGKISDGTIVRADVTTNFKAPYSDTSDYARAVNIQYVDSARIATNTYKLEGNNLSALDGRFVNESQSDAVSTNMIQNGAVTMAKINQSGATTGQVIQWNGSTWVPATDTSGGPPTGPASGDLTGNYPSPSVANDVITSAKIQDGTIIGTDIAKPLILSGSATWPNAVLNVKNSAAGQGISIDTAGYIGLQVKYSFADGVNVLRTDQSGFSVDSAGGSGIRIIYTNFDGIGIDEVGYNGLYVMHAGASGIGIDSSEDYGAYAYGNLAGGNFIASSSAGVGVVAHAYNNASTDTAIQAYGKGLATGGWYTGGLLDNKSAPCLISPELGIVTAGSGMLTNGKAEIAFDPLFTENIRTDVPIRITVTPKGKPAGFLYVTESKTTGFKVNMENIPGLEKNSTDVTFDWIAFGTLKEHQTSPQAQTQWQKMIQERNAKREQRKLQRR